MTPKEKSEELFNKINSCIPIDSNFKDTGFVAFCKMERDHFATKKIALIMIDEITRTLRKNLPEFGLGKGYWYDVKKEIEKL